MHSRVVLKKLEETIASKGYAIRYEKGNFTAGYCLLHNRKVVIINRFFTLKGKIECLKNLIRQLA